MTKPQRRGASGKNVATQCSDKNIGPGEKAQRSDQAGEKSYRQRREGRGSLGDMLALTMLASVSSPLVTFSLPPPWGLQ